MKIGIDLSLVNSSLFTSITEIVSDLVDNLLTEDNFEIITEDNFDLEI